MSYLHTISRQFTRLGIFSKLSIGLTGLVYYRIFYRIEQCEGRALTGRFGSRCAWNGSFPPIEHLPYRELHTWFPWFLSTLGNLISKIREKYIMAMIFRNPFLQFQLLLNYRSLAVLHFIFFCPWLWSTLIESFHWENMHFCCVRGCKSRSDLSSNVSFHNIPQVNPNFGDEYKALLLKHRKEWFYKLNLNLADLNNHQHTKVCSLHFNSRNLHTSTRCRISKV